MKRPVTKINELSEVRRRCNTSEAVAFMVSAKKTVSHLNNSVENAQIMAVSHDYASIFSFELREGRYFSESESHSGNNIAVIGDAIAENLFDNVNPVGKQIKLFYINFDVVGIFKKEGENMLGSSHDNQVFIPVNSVKKLVDMHSENIDATLLVKAKEGVSNEQLKDELKGIMRSIRKTKPLAGDDFALNETSILSGALDAVFKVIGLAGWIIGGFSILVGGFGIANIMFVSVKERTNIIGIQKSLGAKNYFILLQFLFEAIILCLIGGSIGLMIVFSGTLIVNGIIDMKFALTWSNIILGLAVSAIIGVISGFVPAFSAAKMDPVVAIRAY